MRKRFLSVFLFGALLTASTGSFMSCKDYDDDIDGLSERIDANQKTLDDKAAALQAALDAAKQEVAQAQTAAAKAQESADKAAEAAAAAKEAVAQAKADAIAEAQRLVNELKSTVNGKVDQSVYDEKMSTIDATINTVNGKLNDLEDADVAIKLQIKALEDFKTAIDKLNLTTDFPQLKNDVEDLIENLGNLETQVNTNKTDISTLKTDLGDLSDDIDELNGYIDGVCANLNLLKSLLSHRLTSLTFAPTNFVNGIEVINFATLEYTPWTNLLADETDGKTTTSINDGKTQAVYYANPSSVEKADIKGLTVLAEKATNTVTRAGEQPIIEATIDEIVNGRMTVNLKKLTTESFKGTELSEENNKETFTLIALKADIKLTAEEEEKGIEPTVVSDWARLTETSVTPYIHYTEYKDDKTTEDLENGKIPHFYPYTTIHDKEGKEAICTTDGKYIIKHLEYTETFDLNTLVGVCDKTGNLYDAKTYGLAFEFNLVDYYLQDGTNSEEKTNQKDFAKIDKGVISSCARNGQSNNRDAIGREPMVQVVLKNTSNKEVVDVRYFKIAWTAKRVDTPLGNLTDFTEKFVCNKEYIMTVGTKDMNDKVYAVAVNGGISKDEFHTLYTLDNQVYASLDDAKAGITAATNLGVIEDIVADGSTTTHNLKWTRGSVTITEDEYEAGEATRTVYGRYYRKSDNAETFTFSLTLTLTIDKMAFVGGYNQTYWSAGSNLVNTDANKTFQVNPALTSDANYGIKKYYDCRIIADMLKGYNLASGKLTEALNLTKGATDAEFVFDGARLKDVLGTGWTVANNGLSLMYNGVEAAAIWETYIKLAENSVPTSISHGVATTAAQKLLGKNVPVKLVATNCANITVELDHFLVNFINPLEMSLGDITESFKDLLTDGSSISVDKIATIKEAFGEERIVWKDGKEYNTNWNLVQWYNVQGVTWDITNATTNLKKEGNNIIITNDVKASSWSVFTDKYKLTATPNEANAISLTFHNNSGAHIQQEFQIAIPVFVKTKWNPVLSDPEKQVVVLTVKPGNAK